ncbi:MAG: ATP-binding protein [Nannocystaceae bacterium]|nr:ATP-binding protein [Nannocystaceae bacterium]
MSTPQLHKTEVDLDGLMRVLGQHLYSTPNVVVRELVQNAHDSCVRRAHEQNDAPQPTISIRADPTQGWLHVEDNGAGLTHEEIQTYLATVGRGRTRELREDGADGLIGLFGLGFLSTYVVAERTEVWTTSHKDPANAWRFTSRSGHQYTIEEAASRNVGTCVSLRLKEAHRSLGRMGPLRALLEKYCSLLSIPLTLEGYGPINGDAPPWRDADSSPLRRRKQGMAFAERYEQRFTPLCILEITDGPEGPPGSSVQGLLWIQDGSSYGSADNRNVSVFVRGMLVDDDARHLLPEWASFVGAIVESDQLVPTASREDLQRDEFYDHARRTLENSIMSELARLAKSEPHTWRRVIRRHNEALLGCSLAAPGLFDLVAEELTVPTSMGDLDLEEVLRRSAGTIYVSQSERPGVESLLYRARDIPVVLGRRYGALGFVQRYCDARSGAVHLIGDGADERMLGVQPKDALDARLVEWFGANDLEVLAARYEPKSLPFVALVDRKQELKARIEDDKADAAMGATTLALARSFTKTIQKRATQLLYVNLGCPAIEAVLACQDDGQQDSGVRLLRAVLGMLTAQDDLHGTPTLDEALLDLQHAVCALTGPRGDTPR